MITNWRNLVLAWLYDPPDKVFDLRGVRTRAAYYASAALGSRIAETELHSVQTQHRNLEARLPVPYEVTSQLLKPDQTLAVCQVDFLAESGAYARHIAHPLSGASFQTPLEGFLETDVSQQIATIITNLTQQCPDTQSRFLALWRFLPEYLEALSPAFALMPADAGIPDHSIWNHADLQAALAAATSPEDSGALLSFTLGPVQGFIEQARSLRDLWSGSYILSWLAFQSMQPVLDACGPTALIFPTLRGNPLYDLTLYKQYPNTPFHTFQSLTAHSAEARDRLLTGSLPNTFLALVPMAEADSLALAVEHACRRAWQEMCETVRVELERLWHTQPLWTADWQQQIEHFWDIRTATVPLQPREHSNLAQYFTTYLGDNRWPPNAALSHLQQLFPTKDTDAISSLETAPPGLWMLHTEMIGRVLSASKQVRHIPLHARLTDDRAKCTLMGTFEQMGPGGSATAQRTFWESVQRKPSRGTHLRHNERLCAIALVKRFGWSAYFAGYFCLDPTTLRFSDTATIAACEWLQWAQIDPAAIRRKYKEWSGQWLFQEPRQWDTSVQEDREDDPFPDHEEVRQLLRTAFRRTAEERHEGPRPYYAVFVMDGDHMGEWLSGKQAPQLQEAYHPKFVAAFRQHTGEHPEIVAQALTSKRPLSPVLHAAVTAALGNFAQHFVPEIVAAHNGELIYAGGDDVLALLPTRDALRCLDKLRHAYSGTGNMVRESHVPQGWALQDGRFMVLMGAKATVSVGLAIAHYKADLREVLQAARQAENTAKQGGRAAVGIALLRRSGESSQVVCPWEFVETLQRFVEVFAQREVSDRWVYQLRGEADTLGYLGKDAIAAEIARAVNHGDVTSCRTLVSHFTGQADSSEQAGAVVSACYLRLREILGQRAHKANRDVTIAQRGALEDFIVLVQSASFLARGRERE